MANDGRYPSVLLFGAPGVGKGTQGKLLGQIPGFVHMASGDIFRSLDRQSELGRKFHEYSSKGLLVPDAMTVSVWLAHVRRCIEAGTYRPGIDLLVLDGIPRNVAQCRAMDAYIEVLLVVHLVAPDVDEMVMGMPHRGRLNVLAHTLRKPYELILGEFEGSFLPWDIHGDGDV